ncbi:hypothetical protein [Robertmurraya siralis]|uniref:hypothetical protein n=1 Tax=Robertmurraya siralis TaxID=77777 RepID=UPI0014769743|nr:hypothetical protein [Robertmurraya siralis]
MEVNAEQIIDKLLHRIGQDAKVIAFLESMVEMLKEQLNEYKSEEKEISNEG